MDVARKPAGAAVDSRLPGITGQHGVRDHLEDTGDQRVTHRRQLALAVGQPADRVVNGDRESDDAHSDAVGLLEGGPGLEPVPETHPVGDLVEQTRLVRVPRVVVPGSPGVS